MSAVSFIGSFGAGAGGQPPDHAGEEGEEEEEEEEELGEADQQDAADPQADQGAAPAAPAGADPFEVAPADAPATWAASWVGFAPAAFAAEFARLQHDDTRVPFRFIDPPTRVARPGAPRDVYAWPLVRVDRIPSKGNQLGVVANRFIKRGLLIPYNGVYTNGTDKLTDRGQKRDGIKAHRKQERRKTKNATHTLELNEEKERSMNPYFVDGRSDLDEVLAEPEYACLAATINEASPGELYNCSYSTHANIVLLGGKAGPPAYPLYPRSEEHGVIAHDGYVVACVDIWPGEELLVWYGARRLRDKRGAYAYAFAEFTPANIKDPPVFRETLLQLRCLSDAVTRNPHNAALQIDGEQLNALGGPLVAHSRFMLRYDNALSDVLRAVLGGEGGAEPNEAATRRRFVRFVQIGSKLLADQNVDAEIEHWARAGADHPCDYVLAAFNATVQADLHRLPRTRDRMLEILIRENFTTALWTVGQPHERAGERATFNPFEFALDCAAERPTAGTRCLLCEAVAASSETQTFDDTGAPLGEAQKQELRERRAGALVRGALGAGSPLSTDPTLAAADALALAAFRRLTRGIWANLHLDVAGPAAAYALRPAAALLLAVARRSADDEHARAQLAMDAARAASDNARVRAALRRSFAVRLNLWTELRSGPAAPPVPAASAAAFVLANCVISGAACVAGSSASARIGDLYVRAEAARHAGGAAAGSLGAVAVVSAAAADAPTLLLSGGQTAPLAGAWRRATLEEAFALRDAAHALGRAQ